MPVMMTPFIITDRYAGPQYFCGKVQAPTSFEFISRFNLRSASAVQGALRPLLDDETVTYMDDAYFIPNRFFALWLARRY